MAEETWLEQRPQRQDSLEDQLADLHRVAARLGMYDAADWLWKRMREPSRQQLGAWLVEQRGWDTADVDELNEAYDAALRYLGDLDDRLGL